MGRPNRAITEEAIIRYMVNFNKILEALIVQLSPPLAITLH